MEFLADPQTWASLLTLTLLEIVLGVDNIVFVAILAGRLPAEQRHRARQVGLMLALVTRLALLASIAAIMSLTKPLFVLFGQGLSWRDLVLIAGGFFLLYKGTREIHHQLEADGEEGPGQGRQASFAGVIVQIMLFDMIFSLDTVITAIGMADKVWVMATAIVIAVAIMLQSAGFLAAFIERHPTVRMLALSFLLLIGMTLIANGAGFEVPKGYIYAAITFSIGVEALNQVAARRRRNGGKTPPVRPHSAEIADDAGAAPDRAASSARPSQSGLDPNASRGGASSDASEPPR